MNTGQFDTTMQKREMTPGGLGSGGLYNRQPSRKYYANEEEYEEAEKEKKYG